MTYIEQKQKEAREYMGFNRDHYANKDLDTLTKTTIIDTLQTLLDSEELQEKLYVTTDAVLTKNGGPNLAYIHNTAITAIREKLTKLMNTKQAE